MSSIKIDPILLSVFARSFKAITDEMSISMEQTTRSPILCEAKDYVTGLYDADGNMLEQTENLPILAFSLAPVCKYIKEFFGDEIYPGDVIFHNDVFSLGNQNNDVAAFKPVFLDGELVAWTAVKGHQADIGGNVAGGYNPNAVEVWQEALRIPPVKVVERGKGDGIFITTTGVGVLPEGLQLGGERARGGLGHRPAEGRERGAHCAGEGARSRRLAHHRAGPLRGHPPHPRRRRRRALAARPRPARSRHRRARPLARRARGQHGSAFRDDREARACVAGRP